MWFSRRASLLSSWLLVTTVLLAPALATTDEIPPYIKQCHRGDPKLYDCVIGALEHLKPYLAHGIPEIELPAVEPFKMDSLSLQLTDGPQGYKITLRNMDIYGVSDFEVKSVSLGENGEPFKARIFFPKLKIEAKYTSSGVLLIIPASGGGDFHANFEGVYADLTGMVSAPQKDGRVHLHVDTLSILIDVKKVDMKISNAFRNNAILLEATNLFLRQNGQIVLEIMQPQLQTKLATEFKQIANHLLDRVPRDWFYVE